MSCKQATLILVLALALTLSPPSQAQVDPVWLEQWNEAVAARPAALTGQGRIAPVTEPGTPLRIDGTVLGPDGTPAGGVLVLSYHRDDDGFDFGPGDAQTRTWRLQGWVRTNEAGRFEFFTIRPAPDALGREGAHIHFTLVSERHGRQWAPKIFFADDPLVSARQRTDSAFDGEFGSVRPVTAIDGGQEIEVSFRLRENGDF